MSDNSGNGGFVLYCVSGCYAEVYISWEIVKTSEVLVITGRESLQQMSRSHLFIFPDISPKVAEQKICTLRFGKAIDKGKP